MLFARATFNAVCYYYFVFSPCLVSYFFCLVVICIYSSSSASDWRGSSPNELGRGGITVKLNSLAYLVTENTLFNFFETPLLLCAAKHGTNGNKYDLSCSETNKKISYRKQTARKHSLSIGRSVWRVGRGLQNWEHRAEPLGLWDMAADL